MPETTGRVIAVAPMPPEKCAYALARYSRSPDSIAKSIEWVRVHDLPDFVYFNHSIHVNKGIGCSSCHGQVNEMPMMWKVNTLNMNWCLSCHRDPAKFIRPKSEVFNINYKYPANQAELGPKLVKEYHVQSLTDCVTCHR